MRFETIRALIPAYLLRQYCQQNRPVLICKRILKNRVPQMKTGQTAETPEEVVIVVSDMHLSDGLRLPNGKRNPLEEFEADEEFYCFLETVAEKFRQAPKVRLVLLGDIFDPQAATFRGKLIDTPYEAIHLYKIRRIAKAHPLFFSALKKFLAQPGRTADFHAGNHDLFVAWKKVQELIVKKVSAGSPEKVRFLFSEDSRGVHYFHGNFEPHSATNLKQVFLTEKFGIKLKRPLLNYPYGTILNVELTNKLKRKNRLIGRLRAHDHIWRDSLMRDWGFGVFALVVLVWNFIYNRFFAFWDVRRKARLSTTLKIILWTITGYDLKEYARRIFEDRPETKVVICGHDHEAARVTLSRGPDSGTYINTGTWTKFFDIAEEPLEYKWKNFREIERYWRRFLKFMKRQKVTAVTRLTFALVEHYSDRSISAKLMEFKPDMPKEKQFLEVI